MVIEHAEPDRARDLVLDARRDFVSDVVAQVRIDRARRGNGRRVVRVVVRARRREEPRQIELVRLHDGVVVQILPRVAQRRRRRRLEPARCGHPEPVVAREIRLQHRLARAAQVVGEPEPR